MKKGLLIMDFLSIMAIICTGCTSSPSVSKPNNSKAISVSSNSSSNPIGDEKVTVPDLVGSQQEIANQVLPSMGLIPKFKTDYSDSVEKGLISKIEPSAGEKITKGSSIIVHISNGPEFQQPQSIDIRYWHINDYSKESYQCNAVINKDQLEFELYPTVSVNQGRLTEYVKLVGTGVASEDQIFNRPISFKYTSETPVLYENKPQRLKFNIPISNLSTDKPTALYLKLDLSFSALGNAPIDAYIKLVLSFVW